MRRVRRRDRLPGDRRTSLDRERFRAARRAGRRVRRRRLGLLADAGSRRRRLVHLRPRPGPQRRRGNRADRFAAARRPSSRRASIGAARPGVMMLGPRRQPLVRRPRKAPGDRAGHARRARSPSSAPGSIPQSKPGEHRRRSRREHLVHRRRRRPAIGRITPSGAITEFRDGLDPKSTPAEIVAGSDGNLWFGDLPRPRRSVASPPHGAITEFGHGSASRRGELTAGPVVGPDGNLWIAGGSAARGRTDHPAGRDLGIQPGLARRPACSARSPRPDGNLWFTGRGVGPAIGRVTPSGEITEVHRLPSHEARRTPAPTR